MVPVALVVMTLGIVTTTLATGLLLLLLLLLIKSILLSDDEHASLASSVSSNVGQGLAPPPPTPPPACERFPTVVAVRVDCDDTIDSVVEDSEEVDEDADDEGFQFCAQGVVADMSHSDVADGDFAVALFTKLA